MPRGINRVSPGDDGNILMTMRNASDSADVIKGMRAYLVSPPFMITRSSGSRTGPVDIKNGQDYTFDLHYEISTAAPLGCFRSYFKLDVPNEIGHGMIPDPEDDATPLDFVVLPSSSTSGRFWAELRAAPSCRRRMNEAEVPNLKTACRHKITAALQNVHASSETLKPLFFSDRDRTRQTVEIEALGGEAAAGGVPAILELGFRNDPKSRGVLLDLYQGPSPEGLLSENGKYFYDCDRLLSARIKEVAAAMPAARQALARRGDPRAFNFYIEESASNDGDAVLRSVAAFGYIGDRKSVQMLAKLLDHPGIENGGAYINIAYATVRALEPLYPEVSAKIENDAAGPEQRLQLWRKWAKAPKK